MSVPGVSGSRVDSRSTYLKCLAAEWIPSPRTWSGYHSTYLECLAAEWKAINVPRVPDSGVSSLQRFGVEMQAWVHLLEVGGDGGDQDATFGIISYATPH